MPALLHGALCLECAKNLDPGSPRDFLGPGEAGAETTFSKPSYQVFFLLVALGLTAYYCDLAEMFRAATTLEFWLEGPATQVLATDAVLLLIGRLI